ncbi:MAG: hypothetical protein ACK4ZJ_19300, partial [Allorhizobium sp.]
MRACLTVTAAAAAAAAAVRSAAILAGWRGGGHGAGAGAWLVAAGGHGAVQEREWVCGAGVAAQSCVTGCAERTGRASESGERESDVCPCSPTYR